MIITMITTIIIIIMINKFISYNEDIYDHYGNKDSDE